MKLSVITPIPTPYRDPVWNAMAALPGVELEVFYCAAGSADRPWAVDWEFCFRNEVLPGRNLLGWRGPSSSCWWNPGIRSRLDASRPDAILVGGYNHPTMLAAIRWARANRVPYFLMCETWRASASSAWKAPLRRSLLRWVIDGAAGFFPTGIRASEFLVANGAARDRLCLFPNPPDVKAIEEEREAMRDDRSGERRKRGITANKLVLFVGRFVANKHPDLVLEAFARVVGENPDRQAQLALIGDGPMRPDLEASIDRLGLRGRVALPGFLPPREVYRWMTLADVFVLPSSETWGVAPLEAAVAGAFIILSDQVGCAPDLVSEPSTGEIVAHGQPQALAAALDRVLDRPRIEALGDRLSVDWTAGSIAARVAGFVANRRDSSLPVPADAVAQIL